MLQALLDAARGALRAAADQIPGDDERVEYQPHGHHRRRREAASHSAPDDSGSGLRTMVMAGALGALLLHSWRITNRVHRHRYAGRPAAKPHHVQTWEGEGGQSGGAGHPTE